MNIVTPSVTLIAATKIDPEAIASVMDVQPASSDAETLVTFAGRACYQSFRRPNPATEQDADYLTKTLFSDRHWSIAEHATATFYLTGVSRALTHELVRHRHLSFSQLSQRYVSDKSAVVVPPALRGNPEALAELEAAHEAATDTYNYLVDNTDAAHRKQVREAARAVLPNMTETRIVVSGNLRAWAEVTDRRTQPDADAEIQEVMRMVRQQLHDHVSPHIFPINK